MPHSDNRKHIVKRKKSNLFDKILACIVAMAVTTNVTCKHKTRLGTLRIKWPRLRHCLVTGSKGPFRWSLVAFRKNMGVKALSVGV